MRNIKDRLLDLKNLKFELHEIMRYDDVGDYYDNTIVAYDFQDNVITNAIFLHEFIEYTLIKSAGIDPALIDKFDTDEKMSTQYPKEYALYSKFHDMANMIEKRFIENLGLSWEEHDKKINMTKVKTALQEISDELHKSQPNEEKINLSKDVIREQMEEKR